MDRAMAGSEPGPRFTLEDHADALFDAFVELGIQRAVVVGLSCGRDGRTPSRVAVSGEGAGLAILGASAKSDSLPERLKYRAFIAMHRLRQVPVFALRA